MVLGQRREVGLQVVDRLRPDRLEVVHRQADRFAADPAAPGNLPPSRAARRAGRSGARLRGSWAPAPRRRPPPPPPSARPTGLRPLRGPSPAWPRRRRRPLAAASPPGWPGWGRTGACRPRSRPAPPSPSTCGWAAGRRLPPERRQSSPATPTPPPTASPVQTPACWLSSSSAAFSISSARSCDHVDLCKIEARNLGQRAGVKSRDPPSTSVWRRKGSGCPAGSSGARSRAGG